MVFRIASSPYTHNQRQTSRIMLLVLLAAVPGIVVQTWFFGWGTVLQIVLAALTAWATEAAILKLRKQPVAATLKDNSALLTGLLLAVSIPPLAPWWMVVLGTAFAVVIAKQLYGGLGHNPFNPAMIGYVVLLISFPVQMTSWLPSYEIAAHIPAFSDALQMIFTGHTAAGGDMASLRLGIDGVSQATPLDTFKTSLHAGHSVQQVLQLPVYGGVLAGLGWQWVNIAWLAGGLFLLWQKAIRWHIPVSFLVSLGLCATLGWIFFAAEPGLTADAFALRGDHAWRLLYPDRSGDGLNNQPRPSDLWRPRWPAGLAHPQLRWLSGRRGVCRSAGEYYRAADRLLHAPARIWPPLREQ
ncbi:electron transport complex protein RnfD [Klebsiella pneumoniae]|nr:electron transport complex protein RnfD [Klebsiella pneumoniae]